jgi:hypothetical protein
VNPKDTAFNSGARACLTELISLLSDRIAQVDRDSRAICRDPQTPPVRAWVTQTEATGTIDALNWTVARVQQIRARYEAS